MKQQQQVQMKELKMNAKISRKNIQVSKLAAVALFTVLSLLSVTPRVAANHLIPQDNSAKVICSAITECDYINLHNHPSEGFIVNAMFSALPVSADFERQPIFGYIEMHTRLNHMVAGVSITIPLTGDIVPAASNLHGLEGQPIYDYLFMHSRSTNAATTSAAVSPLPTAPAFVQMPIYGYIEKHNR
jgi:hypothetical protein